MSAVQQSLHQEVQAEMRLFEEGMWRWRAWFFLRLLPPVLLVWMSSTSSVVMNLLGMVAADRSADEARIAALGMALSFNYVFVISAFHGPNEFIGVKASFSFGRQDFDEMKLQFARGMVSLWIHMAAVFALILFFAPAYFALLGVDPASAPYAVYYLKLLYPLETIRFMRDLLVTYLLAQNFNNVFGLTTICSFAVGAPVSVYCVFFREMGLEGALLGRLVYELANAAFVAAVCYRADALEGFSWRNFLRVFREDWAFYRDLSSYSAMYYCECLATNTGIILATQIADVVQLAGYSQLINVVTFQQHLGTAYNNLLKLRINYFLASDKPTSAKLLFTAAVFWYLALYAAMCAALWLAGPTIALAYNLHNLNSRQCLGHLLAVYKYLVVVDLMLVFVSTVARLTKMIGVSLMLGVSILIFAQFAVSLSLIRLGRATSSTVLTVSHVLHMVHFSIMIAIFLVFDWAELTRGNVDSQKPQEDLPLLQVKETE